MVPWAQPRWGVVIAATPAYSTHCPLATSLAQASLQLVAPPEEQHLKSQLIMSLLTHCMLPAGLTTLPRCHSRSPIRTVAIGALVGGVQQAHSPEAVPVVVMPVVLSATPSIEQVPFMLQTTEPGAGAAAGGPTAAAGADAGAASVLQALALTSATPVTQQQLMSQKRGAEETQVMPPSSESIIDGLTALPTILIFRSSGIRCVKQAKVPL